MAELPPVCPWRLDIVRAVLRGTRCPNSPLRRLSSEMLKMIVRRWAWPEVLVTSAKLWEPLVLLNVLIREMVECNPGVTETKLREGLELNPDSSIKSWNLQDCNLGKLPEMFGALRIPDYLDLSGNKLSSLPASFGLIEVSGNLDLSHNQLGSLPDSFGLFNSN